jgi:hypothetical protein
LIAISRTHKRATEVDNTRPLPSSWAGFSAGSRQLQAGLAGGQMRIAMQDAYLNFAGANKLRLV